MEASQIRKDFEAALNSVKNITELEELRLKIIGKKGVLSEQLKRLGSIEVDKRKEFGTKINELKIYVLDEIAKKKEGFEDEGLNQKLKLETIDLTLPARNKDIGSIHPISYVINEIFDIFEKMGFTAVGGPEIEDEFHNFEALNIAENHPARQMHDTFYMEGGSLLRTHTSSVQIRTMKAGKPPFAIIAPGKTYRSDSDATHTPMFHQIEALYVAEDVSMGNLKYCIKTFLDEFFGEDVSLRFRSSFFPFTEPSAEVDIGCKMSEDKIDLKKSGDFLEIMGCGMVHPKVLENVGIDSKKYNGFALGLGVERVAMLKYGMRDLRQFFNSSQDWLETFNFAPYL